MPVRAMFFEAFVFNAKAQRRKDAEQEGRAMGLDPLFLSPFASLRLCALALKFSHRTQSTRFC